MTDKHKPDNTGASNEIDEILDYVQVQMKKPVPTGIREEVIGVGDLIVKEEAKQAIQNLIAQETNKAYDEGYEAGEKAKPPKLVDAIEFRQEQYGWNDTKMAAMLDLSKSHYSEFKSGKRGLPVNSIRKAYAIGIPASVLLADDIDHQLTADKESKE